jgi:hypothetical protein
MCGELQQQSRRVFVSRVFPNLGLAAVRRSTGLFGAVMRFLAGRLRTIRPLSDENSLRTNGSAAPMAGR